MQLVVYAFSKHEFTESTGFFRAFFLGWMLFFYQSGRSPLLLLPRHGGAIREQ